MATLSYYSNWEAPLELYNSEFSSVCPPPQTEQLHPQLPAPSMRNEFDFINYSEPNEVFYYDEYCNSHPSSFDDPNQLLTPTFPAQQPFPLQQELIQNYHPKRQRPEELDYEDVMFADSLFNDPVPNPCLNFEQFSPTKTVAPPELPDFATNQPVFNIGISEPSVRNQQANVTPQSIAARQRRRKIADRTQELSKLIPGAHRLNTADMFGASYQYIKFLKAQAGILEFMASYGKDKGEAFRSDELQGLVESTLVQEKLYSTETCLVSTKFIHEVSSDDEMFQAKPCVWKEMRELVPKT